MQLSAKVSGEGCILFLQRDTYCTMFPIWRQVWAIAHRAVIEDQVVDAADGHPGSLPMREQREALRKAILPVHLRCLIPAAKLPGHIFRAHAAVHLLYHHK